ncbi:MAG: hypothetical protein AAB345_05070 [Patescibacteria group bacterium]
MTGESVDNVGLSEEARKWAQAYRDRKVQELQAKEAATSAQKPQVEPPVTEKTPENEEFIFLDEDLRIQPGAEDGIETMIFDDEDRQLPVLEDLSMHIAQGTHVVHDAIAEDDPITADLPDGMGEPGGNQTIVALENECEQAALEKSALKREIGELQSSVEVNASEKIRALESECEQHAQDKSALVREIEHLQIQDGLMKRSASEVAAESAKRDQRLDELEKELGLKQMNLQDKEKKIKDRMFKALTLAGDVLRRNYKYGDHDQYETNLLDQLGGLSSEGTKKIYSEITMKIHEELKSAEEAEKEKPPKKPELTDEELVKFARRADKIAERDGQSNEVDAALAAAVFRELIK